MITGGVTAVGGLLVMQIPDNCEDKLLCIENEEIGMVLLVAGLLTFALGAAQIGFQERTKPPPANAPPAPFPIASEPTAEQPVVIDPNQPPLPAAELSYSDPTQRQFAFQASSAARRGNCQAAIANGKNLQIEVEQKLLAVDDAYARCVSGQ